MKPNSYFIGQLVRVKGIFKDALNSDTPIDPGSVFCQYISADGTETTLQYGVNGALVKDTIGTYHVDISTDKHGLWYYRFYSTGPGQAASESSFSVDGGRF